MIVSTLPQPLYAKGGGVMSLPNQNLGATLSNPDPDRLPAEDGAGGPRRDESKHHREYVEAAELVTRLEILRRMYRVLREKKCGDQHN